MRWWPRSIRLQMLLGLALLEALSIFLFATLLFRIQRQEIHRRAEQRLTHQADSLAGQVQEALSQQRSDWLSRSVQMMGQAPSVARVRVTDRSGNPLYDSRSASAQPLEPAELAQIPKIRGTDARVFTFDGIEPNVWESVKPVFRGSVPYGYVWIQSDRSWDTQELNGILRGTALFGVIWLAASVALVLLLSRAISRPLAVLHRGTRALALEPESNASFPLPVPVDNEIGELITAFNRMVASVEEQRAGLHETLSLLDSLLANAPVGFAFFDRASRFVRVNQVFADLTAIPLSHYLARTPAEVFPSEVAAQFHIALDRVYASGEPVNDLEFHGGGGPNNTWTWLVSAYPVRTAPDPVRWVGVIVRDMSERTRAEEALRRTEKLAATGRLAASIAHEINNPLESLTNLLYLLRNFTELTEPARGYVEMAENQTRRISEIAQKTLRFYRQSTQPLRARVTELIDSILDLYKLRMHTLNITEEIRCDGELTLFCYEGEIRQVLANLIGNAVDATAAGGRLVLRARASRDWRNSQTAGVRFTIADTGSGMTPEVRSRIFEAFFTTKDAIGTGLGLWVTQEIIEKHRGMIHVRSRADGHSQGSGTVFQFFLPDDESLATWPRAAGE